MRKIAKKFVFTWTNAQDLSFFETDGESIGYPQSIKSLYKKCQIIQFFVTSANLDYSY